jgi:hypothetical protein
MTVERPPQAIVILNGGYLHQVYLRYQRTGPNSWRFAGSWAPFVKYFHPKHRIAGIGGKPFLVAEEQGAAGTALSSKRENWFDLTRRGLKPVLSFTSEGDHGADAANIGHRVWGRIKTFSPERVTVDLAIEFEASYDGDHIFSLGSRRDTAVYIRSSTEEFKFDPKASTLTAEQLGEFYDLANPDFRPAAFLKFNLESLRKIASDRTHQAHDGLAGYLKDCPDSPEKRELAGLIGGSR